jgi:hypothetical protein
MLMRHVTIQEWTQGVMMASETQAEKNSRARRCRLLHVRGGAQRGRVQGWRQGATWRYPRKATQGTQAGWQSRKTGKVLSLQQNLLRDPRQENYVASLFLHHVSSNLHHFQQNSS